jgi:hypothetical protein
LVTFFGQSKKVTRVQGGAPVKDEFGTITGELRNQCHADIGFLVGLLVKSLA